MAIIFIKRGQRDAVDIYAIFFSVIALRKAIDKNYGSKSQLDYNYFRSRVSSYSVAISSAS